MTPQSARRLTGASILRVDPGFRQTSTEVAYDATDMDELTELCKRGCEIPRAYLSSERKSEILAMPPVPVNPPRSQPKNHATEYMYLHEGCRCEPCTEAHAKRLERKRLRAQLRREKRLLPGTAPSRGIDAA